MSKLLFEDNSGKNHEIKLSSISTKDLNPGDIIIAYYEVGDESEEPCRETMLQLKQMLENVFPSGVKVIVVATRNGKEDIKLKITKDKT